MFGLFKQKDSPVFVIGNSHTRAFSYNKNFFPLFVGPGKTHCLISDYSLDILKRSLSKALENIKNQHVMLVLGEPDARYCLGKGWYPWEGNIEFNIPDYKPYIDNAFYRYKTLIEFLRLNFSNNYIIFNVTPVEDPEQNKIVDYFNSLLKQYSSKENILFIDINKYIYLSNKMVDKMYLGDQIHLNHNIQPLVESVLIDNEIISESFFDRSIKWEHSSIVQDYKYSKKFGCYILD